MSYFNFYMIFEANLTARPKENFVEKYIAQIREKNETSKIIA